MAWGAGCERQAGVLDHLGVARRRAMAFGAFRVLVFTGQGKVRGGVIERLQRFPAGDGVAFLAVRAQLAGMGVGMARLTSRMEPFEGPVQVGDLDLPAVGQKDVLGVVTLLAVQAGVAAHERISGLLMVELLLGCLPFVDAEVLAVMLRMAAHAVHVALCPVNHAPMVALVLVHQGPNLTVTIQAFELGRTRTENMATGAFQRAIQRPVGLGQRTG